MKNKTIIRSDAQFVKAHIFFLNDCRVSCANANKFVRCSAENYRCALTVFGLFLWILVIKI